MEVYKSKIKELSIEKRGVENSLNYILNNPDEDIFGGIKGRKSILLLKRIEEIIEEIESLKIEQKKVQSIIKRYKR